MKIRKINGMVRKMVGVSFAAAICMAAACGTPDSGNAGNAGNADDSGNTGGSESSGGLGTADAEKYSTGTGEKYEINVGASNTSGAFYQQMVPMCEIINKYSEDITAYAIVTSGAPESISFMLAGELDMGGGSGSTCYDLSKDEEISVMLSAFPAYLQVMAEGDFEGDNVRDLEGKRFNICTADNSTNSMMRGYFSAMGIDIDSFLDVVEISMTEGTEALKEGTVDAIVNASGLGNSTALELASSRNGLKLLGLSDEDAKAICEKSPVTKQRTIPGGTYEGIDNDVSTVGDCAPIIINNSVPEEVVYEMVKILCEHNDEWAASASNAAYSTPENTVADWDGVMDIHPGALKYFREIGAVQ